MTPDTGTEAQRRQITVMFCDVAGSTEMSTRLDPEDLRDLIRSFQEKCGAEVARSLRSALELEDWDVFDRLVAAIAALPPPEPLPMLDYNVARHTALARVARGSRDAATRDALRAVRDRAATVGMRLDVAKLDAALATVG